MNLHRIFYITCYDNELSWLHHNSIWFSSIIINCMIMMFSTQSGVMRSTLMIYNLLQCVYPMVGYYVQCEGTNMPIAVKNYCDPLFFSSYWTIVSYYGPFDIIGTDAIGFMNAVNLLINAILSGFFIVRRYYIVTNLSEYKQYIEKSESYRKQTIEFGEISVS